MNVHEGDWVQRQAIASATWLAAVPLDSLSPVGRQLRRVAVDLVKFADAELKASPEPDFDVTKRGREKQSRTVKGQLPLMQSVASKGL